jgi:hypothetical protein
MGRIDLHDLLLGLQEELAVSLGSARKLIGHPGAKGTASEEEWAAALDGFLPGRYEVATQVKVIDADGAESDLIDIVIHDRHHTPLLFEKGGMCYITAESVYAIFEVKQELTRDDVLYAIKKARSVRGLRRTSADFVDAGGQRRARPLFHIVAGILATASSWTPPFGDPLREALAEADEESRLELGCALQHGAFEATYDGEAVKLEESTVDAGLMFLFLRLFEHLRLMGTVPAVELRDYGKTIEKR